LFGIFDSQASKVYIQTDDENLVGTQRTIIRACDRLSNLIEVNFYVNVSSNSAPEFITDIQTQFALTMNTNSTYTLPAFYDPEGNDVPVVYINSMEN
jgi:hypothetical protein